MHVEIYTDGAARGNPDGPGGYGCVLQYVDSQGILHENFFLLPVGYMFLFAGFAVLAVSGIRSLIKWKRDRRHS